MADGPEREPDFPFFKLDGRCSFAKLRETFSRYLEELGDEEFSPDAEHLLQWPLAPLGQNASAKKQVEKYGSAVVSIGTLKKLTKNFCDGDHTVMNQIYLASKSKESIPGAKEKTK